MSLTKDELDLRFEPSYLDGGSQVLMESVDPLFKKIALMLDSHINDCRELSLAITKLEEAYMWACAATRNMASDDLGLIGSNDLPYVLSEKDRNMLEKVACVLDNQWAIQRDQGNLVQAEFCHTAARDVREIARKA